MFLHKTLLKHVSVSLKLATIASSLFLISFVNESYAQETKTVPNDSVCFAPQDSYRLVSDLEKAKNLEMINVQLEKQTAELLKQTDAYREQIKLTEDKVKAAEELAANQEKTYQDALAKTEELYKAKEDALKQDLKEASKTRWGSLLGSFGLGAAATALLVLIF